MRTIEIYTPDSIREASNQLAACVGASMADLKSFVNPRYTNATDQPCHVVGVQVSDAWLGGIGQPITRPEFDEHQVLDLVAAQSVLDSAVILARLPEDGASIPQDRMVILIGTGLASAMSLTRVNEH